MASRFKRLVAGGRLEWKGPEWTNTKMKEPQKTGVTGNCALSVPLTLPQSRCCSTSLHVQSRKVTHLVDAQAFPLRKPWRKRGGIQASKVLQMRERKDETNDAFIARCI